MPEHSYRVVWYDSPQERHEKLYAVRWRARLNAKARLVRGMVVEVDRLDRPLSALNAELRLRWREQLLANPDLLRQGFRKHFHAEYARIAYHVAFATPVLLRQAKADNRRLTVAITLLPEQLRQALLLAIG